MLNKRLSAYFNKYIFSSSYPRINEIAGVIYLACGRHFHRYKAKVCELACHLWNWQLNWFDFHDEISSNNLEPKIGEKSNLPDDEVKSSAVNFLTFFTRTNSPQFEIVHGLYGRLFSFVGWCSIFFITSFPEWPK